MKRNATKRKSSEIIDKSRVLDVKPLRSLAPIFPSNGEAHFASPPAPEPYPPGFSPFTPPDSHVTVAHLNKSDVCAPVPLRSFPAQGNAVVTIATDASDSDYDPSKGKKRPKPRNSSYSKKPSTALAVADDKFYLGITPSQRETGDREVVNSCLMRYDALRRRFSQLDDAKETPTARHSHLKASNIMIRKGLRTNLKKRIGPVPGVEIGDIFFFRMELCLVGVHMQSMGGIDYISVRNEKEDEPIAVSIVSAGGYDDNAEETNVLIYTGQGGHSGAADQKLERGNLALERSSCRTNVIRVIRGMRDPANPAGKVYVYDGLYKINHSWLDKGRNGGTMFKHELVRVPGQDDGYATWKLVQSWKLGLSSPPGLISPDLSSGNELLKIPVYNIIDEEGLAPFAYQKSVAYPVGFKPPYVSHGCTCRDTCRPGRMSCSCVIKNSGTYPYTGNGILVRRRDMIYECGETCGCVLICKNRVVQGGVKLRLELFNTSDRGWGVRSVEPIRAGTFICEYAGQVVEEASAADGYVFDSSRTYQPLNWNSDPGLAEDDDDEDEKYEMPYRLVISGNAVGNVGRFMNHSCEPNTFWQPVTYESGEGAFVHIAFFAMKHIPPLKELTYDYGAGTRRIPCLCGTGSCRGYFG